MLGVSLNPNAGKGKAFAFLKALVGHQGDECVLWPFCRLDDGYGQLGVYGHTHKANAVMCELAHGRPPTRDHEAAHECRNPSCVNPRHLSWKTRKENAADMVRHGTARFGKGRPKRKLTAESVAEILALKGQKTQREIGAMFGVTHKQISKIHLGQQWPGGKMAKGGFKPGDPDNPFRKNQRNGGGQCAPSS